MKKINSLLIILVLFISCNKSSEYYKFFKNNEIKIPIVEKTIGNKSYNFIIDSGANISLIDSTWYSNNTDLFKYEGTNEIWMTGVSGIIKSNTVIISTKVDSNLMYFATSDLTSVIKALREQKIEVIGLLGSEYLQHNKLILDYNKKALYSAE